MTIDLKPRFRMLIGDDAYVDRRTGRNAIYVFFKDLQDVVRGENLGIDEDLIEGWYRTKKFPIPLFGGADIRVVSSVSEMIQEGTSSNYDWIVSDLSYGTGRETGGIEVFKGIPKQRGVVRAIFTSDGNKENLKRLQKTTDIDYFIAPVLIGKSDKGKELTRTIARHYNLLVN